MSSPAANTETGEMGQSTTARINPVPGPATRPPLVLVTCAGRSGSKWMLRLLDFHPQTLCRNEPERMSPWLKDRDTPDWDAWFRRAMDVGPRIGFVDRTPAMPKDHMRAWVKATRADKLLYTRTLQKLLGRHPEARYPGAFYNASRVATAQRVLKVINARYFICRALQETDHFPIIHMIRHPGGMLNSWLNRFAPTQDQTELFATQQQILRNIHESDPAYASISGPVEGKELVELKLWCWRHAQDHILRLGREHPRYMPVVFEQLSQDPIRLMEPIYAMCGLEFTDQVRTLIRAETSQSESIAAAWKDKLGIERVAHVERVLDGSAVGEIL
ncbi:MAG: sulfotransferase [Phycisphaerales bacterium]